MAQQTLQTIISLSGRVDNSFGQIGESLINLGSQIDGISQKIIDFGKESVKTYVSYDDAMRETQAVGGYTEAQMEKLDELNREIARTTTYTNLESANAMVLIAQAGLDVNETYALLPETLKLAMAGNLELADSVDYLMTSLTSMGYGMDYAETLTDQMAKTASIGMTDIDTLGDSLMRLGSASGEFFTSSEEVLTILSAMSQFGKDMRGAEAGTWLRNFMLSLAAPAGSMDDIVDAMEQLGLAQEEIDEYAANHDNGVAAAAVNSLIEDGLRIYDEQGKLLPAIDIIKSLRDTVRGSAEYSSDLTELTGALNQAGGDIDAFLANTEGLTDNALYNVFAKIFGKRGITTAMNLISISDEEWEQTMAAIVNSDGFAQGMADTMQGGLGGALRELEAAYTEFQTTIGEELAPAVENIADWLKEIVTGLSEMDEDTLDALVKGVGVVAGAGPAMLAVGGAFRLIGSLLTPTGAITAGVIALTAAVVSLNELHEGWLKEDFGDLDLNSEALLAHVNGIGDAFNDTYTDINNYNNALDAAVANFTEASSTLSGDLLTKMITGATLTEEDAKSIQSLGARMQEELLAGIQNSTAASLSYIEMLFGGEGVAEYDSEYRDAVLLADTLYQNLVSQAETLGREFGETLGAAMDDGIITGDEYNTIMDKMQAYNDAMAFAERADQASELAKNLHKAQSVSWDSVQSFLGEQDAIMSANVESAELEHVGERAKWEVYFDEAIRQGWINANTGAVYSEDDKTAFLTELDKNYDDKIQGYKDQNAQVAFVAFDALMSQSGYGEAWQFLSRLYTSGDLKRNEYGEVMYGAADWTVLFPEGMPTYGEENPLADQLYELWRGEHTFTGVDNRLTGILDPYMDSEAITIIPQMIDDALEIMDYVTAHSAESARETVDMNRGGLYEFFDVVGRGIEEGDSSEFAGVWNQIGTEQQDYVNSVVGGLKNAYDFERVLADMDGTMADAGNPFRDYIAAHQIMYGNIDPEQYRITAEVDPVIEAGAVDEAAGEQTITAPVVTEDAANAASAAQEDMQAAMDDPLKQGVTVSDNGSAATTRSYMEGVFSDPITQYVRTSYIGGAPGSSKMTLYAEGGRATEASIFGEAGPEWAIPEAHTARTASLLEQAAEASGFSWPSLSDAGGSSTSDSGTKQLIYSPTIIANDASGVEQKLREDKDRLDKWFRDKQLRDDVEVYA